MSKTGPAATNAVPDDQASATCTVGQLIESGEVCMTGTVISDNNLRLLGLIENSCKHSDSIAEHAAAIRGLVRADPLLLHLKDRPQLVLVQGLGYRVLVATTDTEAAEAYLTSLGDLPRASQCEFRPITDGGLRVMAKTRWSRLVASNGITNIVINPAGPLGYNIQRSSLSGSVGGFALHPDSTPSPEWLDDESRRARRAQASELVDELEAAADAGDLLRIKQLHDGPLASDSDAFHLYSPPVTARVMVIEARARLRAIVPRDQEGWDALSIAAHARMFGQVRDLTTAATMYAQSGYPERAVDAILSLREWLVPVLTQAKRLPQSDQWKLWLKAAKAVKTGLLDTQRQGLKWRENEVAAFVDELGGN